MSKIPTELFQNSFQNMRIQEIITMRLLIIMNWHPKVMQRLSKCSVLCTQQVLVIL